MVTGPKTISYSVACLHCIQLLDLLTNCDRIYNVIYTEDQAFCLKIKKTKKTKISLAAEKREEKQHYSYNGLLDL